ncbi:MAG: HNH endonuclease [Thiobacillus sp.]
MSLPKWSAFKELNEAFYERLKSVGVPFSASGKPSRKNRVYYKDFVTQFKSLHGLGVCVFCGGPLGNPKVDHWVPKAKYPLLSIAPHNLVPICHVCNEPPRKGEKDVFRIGTANAFAEWFHPYFRTGYGQYSLSHDWPLTLVVGKANDPVNTPHLSNLQSLLDLPGRWTEEFELKYDSHRRILRRMVQNGELAASMDALRKKLADWHKELDELWPNYAVHELLLRQAQQDDRLNAWLQDLQDV